MPGLQGSPPDRNLKSSQCEAFRAPLESEWVELYTPPHPPKYVQTLTSDTCKWNHYWKPSLQRISKGDHPGPARVTQWLSIDP